MSFTVLDALRMGEQRLRDVPDGRLDAEYLLAEVLHAPRLSLLLDKGRTLTLGEGAAYEALLDRRARREPLQYILGVQMFMGFSFRVDERVLIPRYDTEPICEAALALLSPGIRALDLCTGSGAIAIALKRLCPGAAMTAVDISGEALTVARENAHALCTEVRFLQGDLFSPVKGEEFDLIVSNPPYIPQGERPRLQREVQREPAMALFAGEDGLDFYRRIAKEAPEHLRPGGHVVLEIGDDQYPAVSALLVHAFEEIQLIYDLGGRPRGITGRWTGERPFHREGDGDDDRSPI